ncbi:hypothetical protein GCM10029992_60350 [Glycomyces albus]
MDAAVHHRHRRGRARRRRGVRPFSVEEALRCGLLIREAEGLAAGWGLEFSGGLAIFSDQRPNTTGGREREHVLGIGGASKLLLDATLREPVETALDLGTGCGVQSSNWPDTPNRSPRPT